MSGIYNFFNGKRNASSLDLAQSSDRKPRSSTEERQIQPLVQDVEMDQSRYYRSSEFQQALLKDQIERSLTPSPQEPDPEETGRFSRYRLSRRSTAASKPSLSLALFDTDREMAEQERTETDVPPPAYNTVVSGAGSGGESSDGSEPVPKHHLPKIHFEGIGMQGIRAGAR